jgi:hypothetical protein
MYGFVDEFCCVLVCVIDLLVMLSVRKIIFFSL